MGKFIKSVIFTTVAIVVGIGLGPAGFAAIGIVTIGKAALVATGLQLLSRILFKAPSVGGQRGDTKQTIQLPVASPRWILGRSRVGGVLVWYQEVKTAKEESTAAKGSNFNVHAVFLIAQGECDAIEEVYIDNVKLKLKREDTTDGVKLSSDGAFNVSPEQDRQWSVEDPRRATIWQYFKADGTQGKSIRDLFTTAGLEGDVLGDQDDQYVWNDRHKLRGISYVHIKLHQPGPGAEDVYRGFPTINFVVRGLKIKDPTKPNDAAVWTDNAAMCRAWFLQERRRVDAVAIDKAAFEAAKRVCDEEIYIDPTQAFPASSARERLELSIYSDRTKRYTVNGVVNADDDASLVEDHMDIAWQGYVVESQGKFYFKPGVMTSASRTISQDDIIDIGATQRAPSFSDRVNQLQWGLVQSKDHDYQQLELPPLVDAKALAEDSNIPLARNVGSLAYVNDVMIALRLLSIQFRRARIGQSWNYTIKPGRNFSNIDILPTDRVLITDENYGLNNTRLFVRKKTVGEDFSVNLELTADPDDLYSHANILRPPRIRVGSGNSNAASPFGIYIYHGNRTGTGTNARASFAFMIYWPYKANDEVDVEYSVGRRIGLRSYDDWRANVRSFTTTQSNIVFRALNREYATLYIRIRIKGFGWAGARLAGSNVRSRRDFVTAAEFNKGYVRTANIPAPPNSEHVNVSQYGYLTCAANERIKSYYPHLNLCP